MRAGIKIIREEVQKEAEHEKRRIRSSGDRADTDRACHFDFNIQTGSCFICVRCGPVRKRRNDLG